MSFYVTITRRPSPNWETGDSISEPEWRAIAIVDFRPPTAQELKEQHPFLRPNDLAWTGHPNIPICWFSWLEGQISVKNPDQPLLHKMASLASPLNAHLIGENGELYNAVGDYLGTKDLSPEPPGSPSTLPIPLLIRVTAWLLNMGTPRRIRGGRNVFLRKGHKGDPERRCQ